MASTCPRNEVLHGDCLEQLRLLPDDSVDSVVTDPPAGIAFMGKKWDRFDAPGGKPRDGFVSFMTEVFTEVFRVLKPGGHGLVWAIPRTSHWTALALEDAGFEIRDRIAHAFGSGFPKSHNVSKALDKKEYARREKALKVALLAKGYAKVAWAKAGVVTEQVAVDVDNQVVMVPLHDDGKFGRPEWLQEATPKVVKPGKGASGSPAVEQLTVKPSHVGYNTPEFSAKMGEVTEPATDDAKTWDGWGTALKPAVEDWWLIRKPLTEKSVVAQIKKTGTGAINIDATRVSVGERPLREPGEHTVQAQAMSGTGSQHSTQGSKAVGTTTQGRWPANLVLSHSAGCRPVGTRDVPGPTHNRYEDGPKPFGGADGNSYTSTPTGTETVPTFECEPGCPVAEMDAQSGITKDDGGGPRKLRRTQEQTSYRGYAGVPDAGVDYGDGGGASRYFKQFECEPGCPIAALDEQSGNRPAALTGRADPTVAHEHPSTVDTKSWFIGQASAAQSSVYADDGGASRYFQQFEPEYDAPFIYNGKITTAERNRDLEDLPARAQHAMEDQTSSTQSNRKCTLCGCVKFGQPHCECPEPQWEETVGSKVKNFHPTVKPIALMRYFVRLVTPPKGLVLDPFAGSGSTLVAAAEEGFDALGIEREADYMPINRMRLAKALERRHERESARAGFLAMFEDD